MPIQPGQLERHTHDYIRHGTTDRFAALDVRAGTVIGETHRRHRRREFRHFLDTIDRNTPAEIDVHLILDNSAIHQTPLVQRWLAKRPRFHVHCTPTSASWLNLVECWFSLLQRRELARGVHRSTRALEQALRASIAETNEHPKPFVWTKTADQILAAVARFCQQHASMLETLPPVTARFRLRELVEQHGFSQSDFARQAELSFATVNRLCTNATGQVSLETLAKIISALRAHGARVEVGDVIEITPDKRRRRG